LSLLPAYGLAGNVEGPELDIGGRIGGVAQDDNGAKQRSVEQMAHRQSLIPHFSRSIPFFRILQPGWTGAMHGSPQGRRSLVDVAVQQQEAVPKKLKRPVGGTGRLRWAARRELRGACRLMP
jgi:hypothetical protein